MFSLSSRGVLRNEIGKHRFNQICSDLHGGHLSGTGGAAMAYLFLAVSVAVALCACDRGRKSPLL